MKIKKSIGIHNRFDIKKNGEMVGYAENLLLDGINSRLCTFTSFLVNIHYGTGIGTPQPNNNELFEYLGTGVVENVEVIRSNPTSKWLGKIVILAGTHTGKILTEVGMAYSSSPSNLITHAMLKDSEGNPLNLEIEEFDVIEIYATVFSSFQDGDNVIFGHNGGGIIEYLTGLNSNIQQISNSYYRVTLLQGAYGISNINELNNFAMQSDVENKKVKLVASRFEINYNPSTDYPITSIVFARQHSISSPPAPMFNALAKIYLGENQINNENIGIGDGATKMFKTKWSPIISDSLVLKIDGNAINKDNYEVIYDKPLLSDYDLILGWDITHIERNEDTQDTFCDGLFGLNLDTFSKGAICIKIDELTRFLGLSSIQIQISTSSSVGSTISIYAKKFFSNDWELIGYQFSSPSSSGTRNIALNYLLSDWIDCEYIKIHSTAYRRQPVISITSLTPLSEYLPEYNIIFNNNAPPIDSVITADYSIKGLPKTSNYAIDAEVEFEFGEGV